MRIAFYAPMKPPDHPTPSGDRRMANLLLDALRAGGHEPFIVSRLRTYDGVGKAAAEAANARAAEVEIGRISSDLPEFDAWLSYHVYHKSPDYLGPVLAKGRPYLLVEASAARKRSTGPWAEGAAAAARAIGAAGAVLYVTRDDREGLTDLVQPEEKLIHLRPFIDPAPFRLHALPADHVRLLAVGMMRDGDKLASYRQLAASLERLKAADWRLHIVGDGEARPAVEEAFAGLADHVVWHGTVGAAALPTIYAAADIYVWPAANEAYGMAFLEAQAAGLPVVAGRVRGVPDVVAHGVTGLLTPAGDTVAFAEALRRLIDDRTLRARLSAAAPGNVPDVAAAAATLNHALEVATKWR